MSEQIRLDKLLSTRGYCTRKEVRRLSEHGIVLVNGEKPDSTDAKVEPENVTFDGEPIDPGPPLVLLLNKPEGVICSHKEGGPLVYDLLPERLQRRNPPLNSVGRLDRETSGLLMFTDDGQLLHRLTSPKHKVAKVYIADVEKPLDPKLVELFAAGTMILDEENDPLMPAELEIIGERRAKLTLYEGRYHQVRRMFGFVANPVTKLHRAQFGPITLEGLKEGEFRFLNASEVAALRGSQK